MEQEGLATMQVAKQHEVGINIEIGKLEVQTNTRIHLMERLAVIINTKPSQGLVWTRTKNDVF
jgi:hypothetical protein